MKTIIQRSVITKELSAKSYSDLPNGMTLLITTHKTNRGLVTYAQAVNRQDGGMSFIMFQDFNKTVMLHPDVKRVTEKSIQAAHEKALDTELISLLIEASDFYNVVS